MKATKGSANPQLVNDTLKRLLGDDADVSREPDAELASPPHPALPRAPARRVLIVDDNAELVETLRAVIASGVPGHHDRDRRERRRPRSRWRRRASTSRSST